MNLISALAVTIGLLGGLATYVFLAHHFSLGLQIWAAFIAWASFYHCGGKAKGLLSRVLANLWWIVMATVTFLAVNKAGATMVAFGLLSANALNLLLEPTPQNPAAVIAMSMVIGGVLGFISEALAGALAKS